MIWRLTPLFVIAISGAAWAEPQVIVPSGAFHPYEKVELTVTGLPEVSTPFDPAKIALDAMITTPAGDKVRVPGFAELRCVEERIHEETRYRATRGLDWRVRYSGTVAGDYQGTATVTTPGGVTESAPFHFTIEASEKPLKGMVRVSADNPRAFAYDDGTSYIPVGEDLCWQKPRDNLWEWMDKLEKNDANWIRVWMSARPCFGIEGSKPYSYNEDGARGIDKLVEKCEADNIGAYLCFDQVRAFGAPPAPAKQWDYSTDYAYDVRNGGPATNMREMFEMPAAQVQYEALLRYAIARWGYSRAVFGWELWNEMDAIRDAEQMHSSIVKWVDVMCRYLHANDPYHHLASTSLGSVGIWNDLWNLPSVDFVNYHDYGGRDFYKGVSQVAIYAPVMSNLARIRKPVLFSEVGLVNNDWGLNDHQNPKKASIAAQDSDNYAFHEALWVPFFTGAAGSGMHWWWEHLDYFNAYPLYRPLVNFVADIPLGRSPMPTVSGTVSAGYLRCFARGNDWGTVAWVWNSRDPWQALVIDGKKPEKVSGASMNLPKEKGRFDVRCYDTRNGDELSHSDIDVKGDGLTVPLPDFRIDVAVKAIRVRD